MSAHPFPRGYYGQRLQLIATAARVLRDAINTAPSASGRLSPADTLTEYSTLRNDPHVFDYLDDLEARCNVNVTEVRALLALAYGATADEFPDHYWTLHSAGFFNEGFHNA